MNLSLAIIAGFAVLLPGLAALAFWNIRTSGTPVRRPELPLTSTTALFMVLMVSLAMHALGLSITSLLWSAATELGDHVPRAFRRPLWPEPYAAALGLLGHPAGPALTIPGLSEMLAVIALETALAIAFVSSPGLDLLLDGIDVSGQGWTYRAVVRPVQHGYTPFAYVLTNPTQGTLGLGYQGVIADLRQGPDGELKFIALAEPESFSYELHGPAAVDHTGGLHNGERRQLGGVLVIEGPAIRNILVHAVDASILDDVDDTPEPEPEPEAAAI